MADSLFASRSLLFPRSLPLPFVFPKIGMPPLIHPMLSCSSHVTAIIQRALQVHQGSCDRPSRCHSSPFRLCNSSNWASAANSLSYVFPAAIALSVWRPCTPHRLPCTSGRTQSTLRSQRCRTAARSSAGRTPLPKGSPPSLSRMQRSCWQ